MQRKIVIPLIGGLVLVVLVGAGISFQLSNTKPQQDAAVVTASPSPVATTTATPSPLAPQTLDDYKDGSYRAQGSYQTPAGTEKISVDLTLANDAITAVTVTPEGRDPQSRQFEQRFASGIASIVVGKPLSEVSSVGKVNGSSLTGNGFQRALEVIKSEAREG